MTRDGISFFTRPKKIICTYIVITSSRCVYLFNTDIIQSCFCQEHIFFLLICSLLEENYQNWTRPTCAIFEYFFKKHVDGKQTTTPMCPLCQTAVPRISSMPMTLDSIKCPPRPQATGSPICLLCAAKQSVHPAGPLGVRTLSHWPELMNDRAVCRLARRSPVGTTYTH